MNAIKKTIAGWACVTAFCLGAVGAEQSIDKVTRKDRKVLAVQDGKMGPLTRAVSFAGEIKVSTNGIITLANGKERELKDGQTLTKDGLLYNPDGSVAPVIDHVTVRNGRVYVVNDGQPTALAQNMVFPNGSVLSADGTLRVPGGRIVRLLDGHVLKLDGTPLEAKDTVSVMDGKVIVQKDGGLIKLASSQRITMNDGSQVFGNGVVVGRDGRTVTIKEGETITLEGPVLSAR